MLQPSTWAGAWSQFTAPEDMIMEGKVALQPEGCCQIALQSGSGEQGSVVYPLASVRDSLPPSGTVRATGVALSARAKLVSQEF